jgi:hypothetical protein
MHTQDKSVRLWDVRSDLEPVIVNLESVPRVVRWNPHQEHELAIGTTPSFFPHLLPPFFLPPHLLSFYCYVSPQNIAGFEDGTIQFFDSRLMTTALRSHVQLMHPTPKFT